MLEINSIIIPWISSTWLHCFAFSHFQLLPHFKLSFMLLMKHNCYTENKKWFLSNSWISKACGIWDTHLFFPKRNKFYDSLDPSYWLSTPLAIKHAKLFKHKVAGLSNHLPWNKMAHMEHTRPHTLLFLPAHQMVICWKFPHMDLLLCKLSHLQQLLLSAPNV